MGRRGGRPRPASLATQSNGVEATETAAPDPRPSRQELEAFMPMKRNNRPVPRARSGRRDYELTPAEFCRIWQTSRDIDEVSERTGMPPAICHARASTYRSM